jgi:hypothetical protein
MRKFNTEFNTVNQKELTKKDNWSKLFYKGLPNKFF